jgi:CelD/BcsL family acetyltransferase involved in cellulose biosynthesis
MLRVEEVQRANELHRYRRDWEELVARSESGSFFLTYEALTTWLDCFWKDRAISFLFVRSGESLVGLALLLLDGENGHWCSGAMVFPTNARPGRANLLHANDPEPILEAVISHLHSTRRRVRLALREVEGHTALVAAFPKVAARHRLSFMKLQASSSPFVLIDTDWESYLGARPKRVRNELKRKRRRIERAGQVDWVIRTGREPLEETIELLSRIESRSWQGRDRDVFAADHPEARAIRELARACAARGWLRVHMLFFDSAPVAYIYGILHRGEYHAIRTAYDIEYRDLSPGQVIFGFALEEAFSKGLKAFDFLGVETRWKNEFATDSREHVNICAFPRSSGKCQCCRAYQQHAKPLLKSVPGLPAIRQRLRRSSRRGR